MDKRRYVSRNPSPNRDKMRSMADDVTGDAAKDGFTSRYRKPLQRAPDYASGLYSEKFACDGLMDENEARYQQLYGED